MNKQKTLVIKLTDARPVKISTEEYPVTASSVDHSGTEIQNVQGECDQFLLKVRENIDHTIVYATLYAATAWTHNRDAYAGVLLTEPSEQELIGAIREVGERANLPSSMIEECIADLTPMSLGKAK